MTPRYKHDCDSCIFLGRHEDDDIYLCRSPQHGRDGDTFIFRWHDDGPAYSSYLRDTMNKLMQRGQSSKKSGIAEAFVLEDKLIEREKGVIYK